MLNTKLLGGTASKPAEYVEDVFSTYLYTGTGASNAINNGIDLAGKGGLVWIKDRTNAGTAHALASTANGVGKYLRTNTTGTFVNAADSFTAFNADGFSLGDGTDGNVNWTFNNARYCSWTFREQPKFFDVVTYTGNGSTQNISHNLGSVPGMIIVKRTDSTGNWVVYHRSLSTNEWLLLNATNATGSGDAWNSTAPTSSVFSVGTLFTNNSGATYVAYLFAHNAGGFGAAGTDNVISCGSFTTDGSSNATINLGYEPQYVLLKPSGDVGNWDVMDVMRGFSQTSISRLQANTSSAEGTVAGNYIFPTATGFQLANGFYGLPSTQYIYMAIRRPMKPPTSGTQVFSPELTSVRGSFLTAPTAPDMVFSWNRGFDNGNSLSYSRLTGAKLQTSSTAAESSKNSNSFTDSMFFYQDYTSSPMVHHAIKRASGFFDVVCSTGAASGDNQRVNHNLTVAPELIILKARAADRNWQVYHFSLGVNKWLHINTNDAEQSVTNGYWGTSAPTATDFGLNVSNVGISNQTFVAYLFATLAGVSKVGSYTGNGGTQAIACGFTGGARFVLIKRTDSTGDWVTLDTARGIVSGNDPFLQFNSNVAEITGEDIVDPDNSGFIVNSTTENINASGGSYIFLAVA